jgi:DNA-directed RNA polymerase subunit RPC12/RpoP
MRLLAMFSFCPHCGGSVGQEQLPGQVVTCKHCGQRIGVVTVPPPPVLVKEEEELIRAGSAGRCPLCGQLVELRGPSSARTFAPHFVAVPQRRICPGSGKTATTAPAPKKPPAGKDLSAYLSRDRIRVVSCQRNAEPHIEELTLEYLDKSDRVRIQVEALRDILGPNFRMSDYPSALGRPQLAVWSSASACVIARRHANGGYETLTDAEIAEVVDDLKRQRQAFFA